MSNLNSSIDALFSKMENFVSTKTVVGEATHIGDIIIVPLVDVSFGLGAGSSDKSEDKNVKNSSGGGLGAKITPSAVIVIQNGSVQMVDVKNQNSVNKLIDMIPGITNKFNFGKFFDKDTDVDVDIDKEI